MMPGLSGYDVCRALRQKFPALVLPVILLTAKARPEDVSEGLLSGANDYLGKPFEPGELTARVRNLLALKVAAASQASLERLLGEMEIARSLQRSLLPAAPPQLPGMEIEVRYQAMTRVGGDFYDFRATESGLGVLLADVSGHGVPAALIVSIVKMAFWFQRNNLARPDRLLADMNEILLENIGGEFVTASYFFVDQGRRKLLAANAGHPALLVQRARDGAIEELRPVGRILGPLPTGQYELVERALEDGDRLIAFTDGLLDARNHNDELFGMERLRFLLLEHTHLSAAELADLLMNEIAVWCGQMEDPGDDIALIVMTLHSSF